MESKSVVTAGMIWLILVIFFGVVILAMPQKRMVSKQQRMPAMSGRPAYIRPTPNQTTTSKVNVGPGADGQSKSTVTVTR